MEIFIMKSNHAPLLGSLLAGLLLLQINPINAGAETVRYQAKPGSKVTIDGTSTIHDWTVEGQIIGGYMEVDSDFTKDLKGSATPKVEVIIPVRSLKSGHNAMDNVMMDAMNQKKYPQIRYRLLELAPADKPGAFTAKGELTVSGVTRTNSMPITIEKISDDALKVKGATTVKMTDFNIKPPAPKLALGMIKTGDDVKLAVEWLTAKTATPVEAK